MGMGIPCSAHDSIKCIQCKKVRKVSELRKESGRPIPKAEGGAWVPAFYFCHCDIDHPVVYDPGDGGLLVPGGALAELIRV